MSIQREVTFSRVMGPRNRIYRYAGYGEYLSLFQNISDVVFLGILAVTLLSFQSLGIVLKLSRED